MCFYFTIIVIKFACNKINNSNSLTHNLHYFKTAVHWINQLFCITTQYQSHLCTYEVVLIYLSKILWILKVRDLNQLCWAKSTTHASSTHAPDRLTGWLAAVWQTLTGWLTWLTTDGWCFVPFRPTARLARSIHPMVFVFCFYVSSRSYLVVEIDTYYYLLGTYLHRMECF